MFSSSTQSNHGNHQKCQLSFSCSTGIWISISPGSCLLLLLHLSVPPPCSSLCFPLGAQVVFVNNQQLWRRKNLGQCVSSSYNSIPLQCIVNWKWVVNYSFVAKDSVEGGKDVWPEEERWKKHVGLNRFLRFLSTFMDKSIFLES